MDCWYGSWTESRNLNNSSVALARSSTIELVTDGIVTVMPFLLHVAEPKSNLISLAEVLSSIRNPNVKTNPYGES